MRTIRFGTRSDQFAVFTLLSVVFLSWPAAAQTGLQETVPFGAGQIELRATASADALKLTTPDDSMNRSSLLAGVQAGFRREPWSFSAEYATGNSLEVERERVEIVAGYSLSDSFDVVAGARRDDIRINDVSYFFIFFVPVGYTVEEAGLDLINVFVGANFESDPMRRAGLVSSVRLYRGWGDVSTTARTESDDSEGVRAELGIRFGPPNRSWIIGAAYESFEITDAAIDLTSEPVVFVHYRYKIPI